MATIRDKLGHITANCLILNRIQTQFFRGSGRKQGNLDDNAQIINY